MPDYNNLSEQELESVIAQAQQTLIEKKNNKRKEVIAEIKALAASINITIEIKGETKKTPPRTLKLPLNTATLKTRVKPGQAVG